MSNSLHNRKFFAPRLHPLVASRRNARQTEEMKTFKQCIGDGRILICVALVFAIAGLIIFSLRPKNTSDAEKTPANAAIFDRPLALVLVPQSGESPVDKEISRLQQQIRNSRNVDLRLEQLGWAFV